MTLTTEHLRRGENARAFDILVLALAMINRRGWRAASAPGAREGKWTPLSVEEAVRAARQDLQAHFVRGNQATEALRAAAGVSTTFSGALSYWERQKGRKIEHVRDIFRAAIAERAEKGVLADVTI